MLAQETRHKFSVQEYLALFDQGILIDAPRTELINGEIIELSPLGFRHAKTQQLIQNFLMTAVGTAEVYQNGSIIADDKNMPEPDVFVLVTGAEVLDNYPKANQLQLVVEVSDTTIKTDLVNDGSNKLGAYARSNVPVVWVVDVQKKAIHEFSEPQGCIYQNCKIHLNDTEFFGKSVNVDQLISE